jgi:hypothetical protein
MIRKLLRRLVPRWGEKGEVNIIVAILTVVVVAAVIISFISTAMGGNSESGSIAFLEGKGYTVYAGSNLHVTGNLEVDGTTDTNLTAGRVPVVGTNGVLVDDAGLTYNTSTDTITTGTGAFTTVTGTSGSITNLSSSNLTAPTGRTATYVIAASDAPANVKAQADAVCTGTEDNTVIQVAVTAATGYSTISLMGGTFNIASEIIVSGKTGLNITGNGILRRINNMPVADPSLGETGWANILRIMNSTHITISNLTFNGNLTNQTYCRDGEHPTSSLPWGAGGYGEDNYNNIWLQSSSYCTIKNVTSFNSGTNNIRLGGTNASTVKGTSDYNLVTDCFISGGRNGILLYSSGIPTYNTIAGTDNLISNNNVKDGYSYAAIYVYANKTNIQGNTCSGYLGFPVASTTGDGIRVIRGDGTLVTNNICRNNVAYGIGVGIDATNVIIENNYITSNGVGGVATGGGGSTLNNNVIYKNTGTGLQATGVKASIVGNRIINNTGYGMLIEAEFSLVSSNFLYSEAARAGTGIGCGDTSQVVISGNYLYNYDRGIYLYRTSGSRSDITVQQNVISTNTYGIQLYGTITGVAIVGNKFNANTNNFSTAGFTGTVTYLNNDGYIAPGEIRTYSGSIATLTQNAYNSVDNPFGQAVRVLTLDIYVSTNATSTTPNIDCGIGSSATTDYTTLFDDLPGETIGFYKSTVATPGAQTVPQLWASGSGNRYLSMSIKDAAATGMVATYTVTVMGN